VVVVFSPWLAVFALPPAHHQNTVLHAPHCRTNGPPLALPARSTMPPHAFSPTARTPPAITAATGSVQFLRHRCLHHARRAATNVIHRRPLPRSAPRPAAPSRAPVLACTWVCWMFGYRRGWWDVLLADVVVDLRSPFGWTLCVELVVPRHLRTLGYPCYHRTPTTAFRCTGLPVTFHAYPAAACLPAQRYTFITAPSDTTLPCHLSLPFCFPYALRWVALRSHSLLPGISRTATRVYRCVYCRPGCLYFRVSCVASSPAAACAAIHRSRVVGCCTRWVPDWLSAVYVGLYIPHYRCLLG